MKKSSERKSGYEFPKLPMKWARLIIGKVRATSQIVNKKG